MIVALEVRTSDSLFSMSPGSYLQLEYLFFDDATRNKALMQAVKQHPL
jgi:hypothetical protein